jgi:hypothetical protein
MAILSLQPSAWQAAGRSDYMGRASGILSKTLEDYEARIINPCNEVILGAQAVAAVQVSGQGAGISGDMTYTVAATIAQDGTNPSAFVVTVTVTWATNATGIAESLTVTRQELNRFPAGCTSA